MLYIILILTGRFSCAKDHVQKTCTKLTQVSKLLLMISKSGICCVFPDLSFVLVNCQWIFLYFRAKTHIW